MKVKKKVYEYPFFWTYSIDPRPTLREGLIKIVGYDIPKSMIDSIPDLARKAIPSAAVIMSVPPTSQTILDDSHCPFSYGTTAIFHFHLPSTSTRRLVGSSSASPMQQVATTDNEADADAAAVYAVPPKPAFNCVGAIFLADLQKTLTETS